MKTIKKLLTFLFLFVFIINSFNFAFAEGFTEQEVEENTGLEETIGETEEITSEEKEVISFPEKLKFITPLDEVFEEYDDDVTPVLTKFEKLGILKEDTLYNLDEAATRGELAFVMANLYAGGKTINDTPIEYEFKDVKFEHEYYNEIALLLNANIIGGYEDGTFRPEKPISTNDALNVLLKVMGYRQMSDYFGGIYNGYLNVAGKLGLTKYADSDENGSLKKAGLINLVDRALDTQIAEITEITNDGVNFASTGETLLSKHFDVVYVSGIVTATNVTGLYSSSDATAKENSVKIGDYLIQFDETVDSEKYLGLNCAAYCDKNDITKGVSIEPIKNRNKRTKILAEDILRFDSSDNTIEYKINEEKRKIYKVENTITVIFNGSSTDGSITTEMLTPQIGELSFIDNNNDGKDDVLFIDSFTTYISQYSGHAVSDYIGDKHGVHQGISLLNAESVELRINDKKSFIQEISEDMVLLVASDKVAYQTDRLGKKYITVDTVNSKHYRIIAKTGVVSGEIKSLNDDSEIVIDTQLIKMSKAYQTARNFGTSAYAGMNINVGRNVNIGIDAYGQGAYINEDLPAVKYGYITHMRSASGFGDSVQVRIFSQDDMFIEPYLADKVTVYKQWSLGVLNEATYFSKNLSVNEVYDLTDLKENGSFKPQLIKYALNSEGKLRRLYIAGIGNDYRSSFPDDVSKNVFALTVDFSTTVKDEKYNPIGGFDGFYHPKNTSICFVVPSDVNVDDKYFDIPTINPYKYGSKCSDCKLYDVDRDLSVGAFVKTITITNFSNTGIQVKDSNTRDNLIISEVHTTWNKEKDALDVSLTGYVGFGDKDSGHHNFITLKVNDSELLSNTNGSRSALSEIPVTDLKVGDFIIYELDELGEIGGFKILWRDIANKNTLTPQKGRWDYKTTEDGVYTETALNYDKIANYEILGGEIKYVYNGVAYVDVGYTNQYMKLKFDGGMLVDLTKGGKTSAVTLMEAREGDYVYWHRQTQYISNFVLVRR